MRTSLIVAVMSAIFVTIVLLPTNCADMGVSEPTIMFGLTRAATGDAIVPDAAGVYRIHQNTWYTPSTMTDQPSDAIDVTYIGDGPELGWRGFLYRLLDPTEDGTLRTVRVSVTRNGEKYTQDYILSVSYAVELAELDTES